VAGPARPSLDVDGALDDEEWLELYRESLRVGSFWPRLAAVVGVIVIAVGVTPLIGVSLVWTAAAIAVAIGMSATYAAGYVWLGPRLRRRRLMPADRTARWRISAERLQVDAATEQVDLAWRDVDRVRVTQRLVVFELTGGRGLLALPRRSATELGEALVVGWAAGENTPVSRG
jgi:hypothetical protein